MLHPTAVPGGRIKTTAELMPEEIAKILAYQAKGHVASFAEGIAALAALDRVHPPTPPAHVMATDRSSTKDSI